MDELGVKGRKKTPSKTRSKEEGKEETEAAASVMPPRGSLLPPRCNC